MCNKTLVEKHCSRARVGKVRPMGQILPAECRVSCVRPAEKIFQPNQQVLNVKMVWFFKSVAQSAPKIIKMARGPKKLPTPVLEGDVIFCSHEHVYNVSLMMGKNVVTLFTRQFSAEVPEKPLGSLKT